MYAQYDGHVDVHCRASESHEVFLAAVRELRRTSFPERSADCWRLERIELI